MRKVVVLPEEFTVFDGEAGVLHRREFSERFVQLVDAYLGHGAVVLFVQSGNLETTMNMSVPKSVVANDQVKRTIASGCNIITMPSVMSTQATISKGPRRNHFGQDFDFMLMTP
jgi:hypothetical protein